MQKKQRIQQEYEEIDLMDYVKVIIKRKWSILNVFLIIVILVGIFTWLTPKIYKIDTSLEVGKIGAELVESSSQVVEKIEGDVYGILVREKLGISEQNYPKIQVKNPEDTDLIKIEIESQETKRAKSILEEIDNLILKEHQERLDKRKSKIEESMKEFQEELILLETKKEYSEGIAELQIGISNLKDILASFQSTRIVKYPTISEKPVKPNFLLNLVIAVILGIFIGIFWAFFKEWWEKNKTNT